MKKKVVVKDEKDEEDKEDGDDEQEGIRRFTE